jgi:hypothetical protein
MLCLHFLSGVIVWLAVLGKILTADSLRKRHIIVVNWCCMRKRNENPLITFYSLCDC